LVSLVFWQGYVEPRAILFFSYFIILISMHELEQVFAIFEDLGISVDCVATSEVSISVSLDPSKIWSRELIQQASPSIRMPIDN
jgi:hypothetical protein